MLPPDHLEKMALQFREVRRTGSSLAGYPLPTPGSRTPITSSDIAEIYLGLGHENQVFEWLEKAYEERARTLVIKVEPEAESRAYRSLPKLAFI